MDHWSYGKRVLWLQPEKIYPYDDASTMPISGINAIPRAIEQLMSPNLEKADGGTSDINNGRYVTLFICFLMGLCIYRWSREAYGNNAALFSLFLFVYCPNLNANTSLLTTDAYAALFSLTTAYFFYRFVKFSGWPNFLLFVTSLAISQVVKQSLVLLPMFFAVASFAILIRRRSLINRWKINAARAVVFIFVMLFVINTAFFFRGTGNALSEYSFYSDTFKSWATSSIGNVPLPLPSPFIEGYDLVKYMLSLGSGHEYVSARSYLFGNYFTGGVWYYYPVVLLLKTPLSFIVLTFVLAFLMLRRRTSDRFTTFLCVALALFFLIVFSLFNSSQHSIRHLLMIFPLLYVVLGATLQGLEKIKSLLIATVVYNMFTFYLFFPNLISYTNELIMPKKNAYRFIASSNIDYGQCKHCYEKYPQNHPEVSVPSEIPSAGNFIIGINYYLDLEGNGKYKWLQRFKPYDHVNHCLLLIKVSDDDIKREFPSR